MHKNYNYKDFFVGFKSKKRMLVGLLDDELLHKFVVYFVFFYPILLGPRTERVKGQNIQ